MAPNYPPDKRLFMRGEAWRLRTEKGWTQRRIAIELGCSLPMVNYYLKLERKDFGRRHIELVEEVSSENLHTLQHILGEAMTAWEKSCTPLDVKLPDGSIVQKERSGDPRYLEQARGIMADMRKIVGADAPEKKEVTLDEVTLKILTGGVSMEDL